MFEIHPVSGTWDVPQTFFQAKFLEERAGTFVRIGHGNILLLDVDQISTPIIKGIHDCGLAQK